MARRARHLGPGHDQIVLPIALAPHRHVGKSCSPRSHRINETRLRQRADNGDGSGFTHNLYVSDIGTLTINNSYFHDAVVATKSRVAPKTRLSRTHAYR